MKVEMVLMLAKRQMPMSRKGGPGWESESDKQFIVKVKVKTDWLENDSENRLVGK